MKDIIVSIKRTPFQSAASVLILFLTLFLSFVFFYLTFFFYGLLGYVETQPQVMVYFQTTAEEKTIQKIKSDLINSGKIQSITYVSKDEALKIYRDLNKGNPLLIEMVSSDMLPASLEINAKEPKFLAEIAEYVKRQPGVDEVDFQKNVVDRLITVTSIFRKLSMIILIFLLLTSSLTIMAITAFKIALKKNEIEISQLLGATTWDIRKPFIIEGMIFGFVSGTATWILFFALISYFGPFLNSYLSGIPTLKILTINAYQLNIWPPNMLFFITSYFFCIGSGGLIGALGNYLSTSKYIK